MDFNKKDMKPAATSVATIASNPNDVHIAASSMKGQQAFQKTKDLTDGPKYYLEDDEKPTIDNTDKDNNPQVSFFSTSYSTPGAVPVDALSMKGQQASQKTKDLSDGLSYNLEDDKKLSNLEQDSISSKRAIRQYHDDREVKQHGKSKKADTVDITGEHLKKNGTARSERQENHTAQILARTLPENTKPPSVTRRYGEAMMKTSTCTDSNFTDVVDITDEQLKKNATGSRADRQAHRRARFLSQTFPQDTKPPSFHDQVQDEDEDEDDATPGAVRVSGMHSAGRGDEEDGQTITSEQNSTFGGATDLQHETSTVASSTRMIVEAQLVEENEREQLEEELRQNLEEELRQKIHEEERGQVAQAEVVQDDGSKTRRRALLCAGSVVILLAIILGSVLGTRDTSSRPNAVSVPATTAPSVARLNNSLCGEALPIMLGGGAIEDSLENAIEQVVTFCDFPNQPSDSQRGLWFKVRG